MVVFYSRMKFFSFSCTATVLLHYIDHHVSILITPLIDTVAMATMLWTSNSGTSFKKDISKTKRPGYTK